MQRFLFRRLKRILFQDFIALLAYEEPEQSPMFHLLSSDYRQHIADCLNRAILGVCVFESFPYWKLLLFNHIFLIVASSVLENENPLCSYFYYFFIDLFC